MWESVKDVLSVPKSGVPSHGPVLGMLSVSIVHGQYVVRRGRTYDAIDFITGDQPAR